MLSCNTLRYQRRTGRQSILSCTKKTPSLISFTFPFLLAQGVNWEGPSSSSAPPLPSAPPSAPVHGPTLPNSGPSSSSFAFALSRLAEAHPGRVAASNPIDVDIPPLIHDNPDDISRAVELSMQSSQQQQSQPPPPSPSQQPLPPPPAYPQSLPPTVCPCRYPTRTSELLTRG
jgi:hypothetical protein